MMERIKKRGRLGKKLFLAMMGIGVAAVLVVSAVSLFQFMETRDLIVQSRQKENEALYETNVHIMTESTRESLRALAVGYAQGVSDNIRSMEASIALMAKNVAELYHSGGGDDSEDPDGRVYLQPGVGWEEVEAEFAQVKGVRELIDNAAQTFRGVSAIYYVTESGMLLTNVAVDYGGDDIDRRTRDWYVKAVQTGGVCWTEIYEDALSREQALTCACPVLDGEGRVCGVIAEDIYLDSICDAIFANSSELFESSFIVDKEGASIAANGEAEFPGMNDRVRELVRSGNESCVEIYPEQQAVLGYARIMVNGWSFCVLMDYDTIIRPADNVGKSIAESNAQFLEFLDDKIRMASIVFLVVVAALTASVFFASSRISRSIVRPVEELTDGVERISTGNLDYPLTVKAEGEIGELAAAFQKMSVDLREYIRNLERVTSERERIGAELDIAANIQRSMLPCVFPAFPDRQEFDIYASMDPAKEVGGDFYDFFMVDQQHLAIVVADVSGKGVPAALFMVIGKTLIKDHTRPGRDLGEIFSEVNNLLCESNSEGLFITAFEGVLDLATGEFCFANAGHETPFVCKRNGVFEPYPIKAGLVLAGMEGMKYCGGSLRLEAGDKIFQYSDGVTEATNSDNELYGMERLARVLAANAELKPEQLLGRVKNDIDAFVGKAPQFDDITMLCLEYKGFLP